VDSGTQAGHGPARKNKLEEKEMAENRSAKTDPQPEAAMPQLMDAQDVSLILKIAPKTVHKLLRKGKLESAAQVARTEEPE
jgi:hypothetical protein